MSDIEECGKCGRPFYVSEVGGVMPGTKELEEIRCPHCGHTFTRRSNGVFQTSKLSAEAEEKWNSEHGKSK